MVRCCCNSSAGLDEYLALKMTRNILNTYMNKWLCVHYRYGQQEEFALHQIGFDCSLGHCSRVPCTIRVGKDDLADSMSKR